MEAESIRPTFQQAFRRPIPFSTCDFWGSHSHVAEDYGLQGLYTASTAK
jgi:hypothetical protein